jgi:hypothetical protein
MLVASPRNSLNRLLGSHHRGPIPFQLDPQLAILRSQDDGFDSPSYDSTLVMNADQSLIARHVAFLASSARV